MRSVEDGPHDRTLAGGGPQGGFSSALPEDILDVLLEDVLNRPNTIKLPMLLEVARDPQNPKSAEAKDVLELFRFPNDMLQVDAEPNRLNDQVLVRYYERDWREIAH